MTDIKMPKLIYGTAWKKEQTTHLVETAVLAGFRGIDTACQPKHYEEPLVGSALHRLLISGIERETLYLQTKFTPLAGHDPDRVPYDKQAPIDEQVAQSFAASLQNLQTKYVDCLILHSPVTPFGELLKVWRAMETIRDSGEARQLGISNCYNLDYLKQLFRVAEVKPAVVQNRFYRETGYDAALRQWSTDQGVVYQSFWTLTANPHLLNSKPLQMLATKYEKSAAQIFFRYLSQIGIVPLTGTRSEQHMKEDLESFDIALDGNEMEQVNLLMK